MTLCERGLIERIPRQDHCHNPVEPHDAGFRPPVQVSRDQHEPDLHFRQAEVHLRHVVPSDRSELVRLRVSRKDKGLSWLQRAPAEPPFGEDRDRAAFVRFLGALGFLLWVAGLLVNDDTQSDGDWTIDEPRERTIEE